MYDYLTYVLMHINKCYPGFSFDCFTAILWPYYGHFLLLLPAGYFYILNVSREVWGLFHRVLAAFHIILWLLRMWPFSIFCVILWCFGCILWCFVAVSYTLDTFRDVWVNFVAFWGVSWLFCCFLHCFAVFVSLTPWIPLEMPEVSFIMFLVHFVAFHAAPLLTRWTW